MRLKGKTSTSMLLKDPISFHNLFLSKLNTLMRKKSCSFKFEWRVCKLSTAICATKLSNVDFEKFFIKSAFFDRKHFKA